MAYDLLLSPRPGHPLTTDGEAALVAAVEGDPALSGCEVSRPADKGEADPMLSLVLREAFDDGEATREEFDAFCAANGLAADPDHAASAAAFLRSKWPTPIVSVGLPDDDSAAEKAFAALVKIAKAHDVRLEDPQARRPLDLERVSLLPPLWD